MHIKVDRFYGMAPQRGARKLGDYQAVRAQNVRLWKHELHPIRVPLPITVPSKSGTIQSIFLLSDAWLHWTQDVDVVRSPVASVENRIHYTGHYNPKSTDYTLATDGGGTDYPIDWYRLGLPDPDNAPTVGTTGGSASDVTRSYVYCYKTAWGEEGPPSPAGSDTGPSDATWNLTAMDTAPLNTFTISSISLSAGILTFTCSAAHNLETGEYITISGVQHYTSLNDTHEATRVSATQFSIVAPSTLTSLELITNGDFSSDTGWTQEAGWSIAAGVASASAGSATSLHRTDAAINATTKYVHTFTLSNYSAGTVQAMVGDSGLGTARSANNTYTETITAAGADEVGMYKDAAFLGDIDDVSVEESPADWTVTREAAIQTTSMTKEIYRTDENGVYRFVASIAVATTSYNDTIDDDDLGDPLPTYDAIAPPGDLVGVISHPDGWLAGFTGNQVCFSEPNKPWAWPAEYRYAIDFQIVALGLWGSRIVIGTEGLPYISTGSHPELASQDSLDFDQACIAKRSMTGLESGVMFASPSGVVMVGAGGVRLITETLMERDDWDDYNPSSMVAFAYDNRYYTFYTSAGDDSNEAGGIVLDPAEPEALMALVTYTITGGWRDRSTDSLYLVIGGEIVQFDAGGAFEQGYHLGKIFVLPRRVTMTAGKVRFTLPSNTIPTAEYNALVAATVANIDTMKAAYDIADEGSFAGYTPGKYTVAGGPYVNAINLIGVQAGGVTFKLYADGSLKHTEVPTDKVPFRMPAGKRHDEYQIEISTNQAQVHEAIIAETPSELAIA